MYLYINCVTQMDFRNYKVASQCSVLPEHTEKALVSKARSGNPRKK